MAAAVFAKLNMIQVSNPHNLKTRKEMFSSGTCSLTTGLENDKSKTTDIYTHTSWLHKECRACLVCFSMTSKDKFSHSV